MSNSKKPRPYLGISGIARYEQHVDIFDIAMRERIDKLGHFVMVGVQATGKSQVQDIENSRGRMWHPVGDDIINAAANEDSGLGLTKPFIHCFFANEYELNQGIKNVMRRTRHYTRGMQFNGLNWMRQDYRPFMHNFRQTDPSQDVILQANSAILNNHTPAEVVSELSTMPVDYILLDPSGGRGKQMDTEKIRDYVDAIYQSQINVGVAVAGGLEASNIESVLGPLVEEYPGLSCDAEGRLRHGPEGQTVLDMQAVEEYILAWKHMVTSAHTC